MRAEQKRKEIEHEQILNELNSNQEQDIETIKRHLINEFEVEKRNNGGGGGVSSSSNGYQVEKYNKLNKS